MNRFSNLMYLVLSYCFFGMSAPLWAQGYTDTGDRVDGVKVISRLTVDELEPGEHSFYFSAGSRSTGEKIYVPVLVVKGVKPGKRLVLTAAVHGDELNGIQVIHELFGQLKAESVNGTVIGVPGVNQPGLLANNRHFVGSSGGGHMVDPNRLFPGSLTGGGAANLYVGAIWDKILQPNADIAIDLHTQSRGAAYPLFVFADFGNRAAQQMAYSLMPDMIKNDPGQEGTLETAYVENGIPAVTFELGAAGQWQQDMIARALLGIKNVMRVNKLLAGEVVKPLVAPFVGSSYTNVYSIEGGFAHIQVKLKDTVSKGDHVATIVDPLGSEVRRYYAPHDGRILSVATAPLREAGAMLVRILR
ncbi:MAG: succinylglutamate desuccinylase/aspartoacylase family protein [Kordiimonas sp.]